MEQSAQNQDTIEADILKKQELLQKEILDKELDKDLFIKFCLEKKERGDDLSTWTYEELEGIVKEFQNKHSKDNKKQQPVDEVNVEQVGKMEQIDTDEKKFKESEIQCRKLERTQLNGNALSISIKNPKEVDKGVFGQNYVLYDMVTDPFGWTVQRRYSDFDWLRQLLVKLYPGFNVPPLPNKKIGTRRFDLDFVMKRMKFLELFINGVCENESFKASELLVAFLSYKDRDKFETKMKEYTSYQPSTYVEEFKSLDGKVIISHDEGNEKYFINISKYFKLHTQILDKLNFNMRQLYTNLSNAAENIGDIAKNFEIMNVLNSRVLMKQTITKSYEEISFFFKNWKKIMIKQNEITKNHFKDFFKYINLEGQAYSSLIASRDELKQKYMVELSKLNAKKEKLFSTGDTSKFELNPDDRTIDHERLQRDKHYAMENMCYKEGNDLKLLYNQLGYYNKMNIHELKKMIRKYVGKFVKNLEGFDEEFYPTINDVSFYYIIYLVNHYLV